jgi:hypothetical protein
MSFVAIGVAAAKPLASAIGGKLRKNESDLIRASFLESIAEIRREQRRLDSGTDDQGSFLRRNQDKIASTLPTVGSGQGPDEALLIDGLKHSAEMRRVAKQLTRSLQEAWVDLPNPDSSGEKEAEPIAWGQALLKFLGEAAAQGIDGNSVRERRDWLWVVCGVRGPEVASSENVEVWATLMTGKVTTKWRERLPALVAHFRHEGEFEAMRNLVESSREIAQNTFLLLTVGIPTVLLGGGAITLLILYIDKG